MFYDLAIGIYDLLVHLAAPFSRKPRKMMKGHWVVYDLLRQQVEKDERYIWFHAASLGEFEQGRPLIESIRERYPDYKILQTFFSPSGYEVRKNYRGADIVCYLPFDKPRNVKKFLDIVNPCMAFFIKYEFWKNYLDALSVGINNIRMMMDCPVVVGGTITPYLEEYLPDLVARLSMRSSFDDDGSYLHLGRCGDRANCVGVALHFIADFMKSI